MASWKMCIRDSSDDEKAELLEALFTKYLPRYNELISDFKNSALYPFLTVWPRLFGTVQDIKAVSYTHLDVYKRQGLL